MHINLFGVTAYSEMDQMDELVLLGATKKKDKRNEN